MNKRQTNHMNRIIEWITENILDKYPRGAVEHDSELDKDYNVLDIAKMLGEEITDLVTYFVTLITRITELVEENEQLKARIKELENE